MTICIELSRSLFSFDPVDESPHDFLATVDGAHGSVQFVAAEAGATVSSSTSPGTCPGLGRGEYLADHGQSFTGLCFNKICEFS